jgi:hypothetical protein
MFSETTFSGAQLQEVLLRIEPTLDGVDPTLAAAALLYAGIWIMDGGASADQLQQRLSSTSQFVSSLIAADNPEMGSGMTAN